MRMQIQVLAKQFAWSSAIAGPDGKFGRTDIKLINDANGNPFGLDEKDPAAKDDIVSASLKVPVGKPIMLILRSRDVIHNFFVRELRMKQDIVPGMEIPFHFQADKIGTYEVPCSELCGLGHHQMRTHHASDGASGFREVEAGAGSRKSRCFETSIGAKFRE